MDLIQNKVCLCIDGNKGTHDTIKMVYKNEMETEMEVFRLKIKIADDEYINKHDYSIMELAIVDLQKQLPEPIQIVCCESCKYGNFCPFGDREDEIFCLRDYTIHSLEDVIDIFANGPHFSSPEITPTLPVLNANKLLHWCDKYDRISDNYYTYNDWIVSLER